MSSLDPDDADKQLQRAVPWVSDPQHFEQRDNETRRLQEDVIEAAKRLERESAKSQPPAEPGNTVGFRLSEPRMRKRKVDAEERAEEIWAELKPKFVSMAPREGWGLRGLAIAAGFLGAMAVSAVVAMIVVNVVHFPTISADASGEERAAQGNSVAATTLGDLAKISEAQAKMTHADEPAVPAETLLASVPPDDIAAAKSPSAMNPRTAKVEPAQPQATAPAASPVPTTSPAPERWRAAPLPQDETASLLKRGRDLIEAGDIASARLMLTLAAEAGNAEACFTLAGTFDPALLAKQRAIGAQGDPAKARIWYGRAAELGSLEAGLRLQALR